MLAARWMGKWLLFTQRMAAELGFPKSHPRCCPCARAVLEDEQGRTLWWEQQLPAAPSTAWMMGTPTAGKPFGSWGAGDEGY